MTGIVAVHMAVPISSLLVYPTQ